MCCHKHRPFSPEQVLISKLAVVPGCPSPQDAARPASRVTLLKILAVRHVRPFIIYEEHGVSVDNVHKFPSLDKFDSAEVESVGVVIVVFYGDKAQTSYDRETRTGASLLKMTTV